MIKMQTNKKNVICACCNAKIANYDIEFTLKNKFNLVICKNCLQDFYLMISRYCMPKNIKPIFKSKNKEDIFDEK